MKFAASIAFLKSSASAPLADVEPLDLLAIGANETGFKSLAARRRHGCDQRPVFARNEFFDLEFAITDEP